MRRGIHARGDLAGQIPRAVLLGLNITGGVVLNLHPKLELAVLAQCCFTLGAVIALTSPDDRGRRSRRARRPQHLQLSSPLSHLALRNASAMVRSR